ncbi:MAG TPA: acetate--CoA ligase family protein [Burkholderiales bacterium]|nr:acetate--CoA ligase family protein [Burkholderiales bacterium]
MKQFDRLFNARAIAVVGVSEDPVRPGSQTVHTLLRNGYKGRIYPVNPKYPDFEGMKCYPSIAAIEDEIDVVVIGVPARGVIPVIEECAAKRVPFAVVLSGGFRESGPEGIERQDRMLAIARAAGMRIVGPNCLGLANIHDDVYAAFGSITRDPRLEKGSVSLVTQSGGFGYSIALACWTAHIGFSKVIAVGNEADIGVVEFIDGLLDDDKTEIIVAYIEGLANGRALLEVGRRALAAGKPVLVWKGGVTAQGAHAAASHTANLTGSYDYYRAMFEQSGIVEIREIHEVVDAIKAFRSGRFPMGRRCAVMGGSGGSAIVFADAAERAGLTLATFTAETERKLWTVVPAIGAVHNPVDFTAGYIHGGNREKFRTAVQTVLDDPGVDALCVNFATVGGAGGLAGAEVLRDIAQKTDKPIVVFLSVPEPHTAGALPVFEAAGIPVLPSPGRAAQAIATLARYREAQARVAEGAAAFSSDEDLPQAMRPALLRNAVGTLSESDSKGILQGIGIDCTRDVLTRSVGDMPLDTLRAPYAVKIVSADIPHKTEIGGVKLNVSADDLAEAVEAVRTNARTRAPGAHVDGVLVSEMITGGFELIAGVVNDVVFGPVVVVGAGGIHAEMLRDTASRLAPFDEATARAMLDELRCRPILNGVRGAPALDVGAVARALAALSRFAWANRDVIAEIDINPLFALPNAAVAADALIVTKRTG